MALSAGMRPKALLSLALPLAVGVEGLSELAEFELAEAADEGLAQRLADCLPGHMRLLDLRPYYGRRSLAARVIGASYDAEVGLGAGTEDSVRKIQVACQCFSDTIRLPVEESREGEIRQVDVREYVDSVLVQEKEKEIFLLSFRAKVSPSGTARPERVVQGLGALAGLDLTVVRVTRTQIHLSEEEE